MTLKRRIVAENTVDAAKCKAGWKKLDDRQLGRALLDATRALTILSFSKKTHQETWDLACKNMLTRVDTLCAVADARSIGGNNRLTNRKEFAPAKGLDFRGNKDLVFAEQQLMEICSSWTKDPTFNTTFKQIAQWRDGKSTSPDGLGLVTEEPYFNAHQYPRNLTADSDLGKAFLPFPGEKDFFGHEISHDYGRTQQEEEAFKAAITRRQMASMKIEVK